MQKSEFQMMMRRLYFHRDSERGVRGAYIWLRDEVEELGEALTCFLVEQFRHTVFKPVHGVQFLEKTEQDNRLLS